MVHCAWPLNPATVLVSVSVPYYLGSDPPGNIVLLKMISEGTSGIDAYDDISITSSAESDQKEEYEVEEILAELPFDAEIRYLVKWKDYPIERSSWEPKESFCDDQILVDWDRKKKDIAEGKAEYFDLVAWENRLKAHEDAKDERKRRRRQKRIRLGLEVPDWNQKSTVTSKGNQQPESGQGSHPAATVDRPHLQRSIASQHPNKYPMSCTGLSAPESRPRLAKRTSYPLFGTSRAPQSPPSTLEAHRKRKNFADSDDPNPAKRLYKLSTGWRLQKAKDYEPPSNIDQLDIRRPSDWCSERTNPLELVARAPRDKGVVATGNNNDRVATQTGLEDNGTRDSVGMTTSTDDSVCSPRKTQIQTDTSRTEPTKTDTPKSDLLDSTSEHPDRSMSSIEPEFDDTSGPRMDPTRSVRRKFARSQVLATVYYGPSKKTVGQVKICGVTPQAKGRIVGQCAHMYRKVEIWFRYLCTVDEYTALCYRQQNIKFSNGYLEGFEDTYSNLGKMAEDLRRKDLMAIHYPEDASQNVLLAYHGKSEDFSFLKQGSNGDTRGASLCLAARSSLQPYENLGSLRQGMSLTNAPMRNAAASDSPTLDDVEAPSVETTSHPVVQNEDSITNRGTLVPDRPVNRQIEPVSVSMDARFNLKTFFENSFSITFSKLAAVNGEKAPAKAFYLMLPSDEANRAEGDVVIEFLKGNGAIVFSSRIPEDWERFIVLDKPGVILFYRDFTSYYTMQSFGAVLRKPFSVWTWSLSVPLDYFQHPTYFQRIFPHGGVVLITEDFMIHDPDGTLVILSWFYEWNKKKFPGSWKIMVRPDILNWLVWQHDHGMGNPDGYWLAIYQLVVKLNTTGHTSDVFVGEEGIDGLRDPLVKDIVMSPAKIPGYGFSPGPDRPNPPKNITQRQRDSDILVEFFAGWALVNCHRFRRFVVVTYEKPLRRWEEWNHVEIRHGGKRFFSRFGVDYDAVLKGLGSRNNTYSKLGSANSGEQPQQQPPSFSTEKPSISSDIPGNPSPRSASFIKADKPG